MSIKKYVKFKTFWSIKHFFINIYKKLFFLKSSISNVYKWFKKIKRHNDFVQNREKPVFVLSVAYSILQKYSKTNLLYLQIVRSYTFPRKLLRSIAHCYFCSEFLTTFYKFCCY